jgi:signal recognition particle receptor subunit alpha
MKTKQQQKEESKSKNINEGRFWGVKDNITEEDKKRVDRSKAGDEGEQFTAALNRFGPEEGDENPEYWSSDEEDEAIEQKGGIFSMFTERLKSFTGNKELSEEDLIPIMEEFSNGLIAKNVAQEIAIALCESIKTSLLKTKTESFTTVKATAKKALIDSLKKILTPKKNIDILKDAFAAKKRGEPYKIVFIGVNGVGKSTSLAKVAYYLKTKGKLSILISACDNFRAGAVEQLKVHSRCLDVPLYDKGYKDDPAYIAQEAIAEAKKKGHDVVLIDTAGRMQDNEPLMKALAKLVHLNSPDLVLFVGEALVGNDATDQLTKFNQSLVDFSYHGSDPRTIDGIILSKCDTVDDKIGAAISMVYSTGKPIVFMGIGEKYPNLKKMNINTIINSLLA